MEQNRSLYLGSGDSEGERSPPRPQRSNSFSEDLGRPHTFLVDVEKIREHILRYEDTDGDERVTIDDRGPKHLQLPLAEGGGFTRRSVRGNYAISSLLQELALLESNEGAHGPAPLAPSRTHAVIAGSQLNENPMERLNRMIRRYFWPALVRRVDADGLTMVCLDPKARGANKQPRIYIPHSDQRAWEYFRQVAVAKSFLDLEVIRLPETITPEYVCSINDRPGILSLDLEKRLLSDGSIAISGKPFIVPGGRFNEMYGWDSYFAALGLLADDDNWEGLRIAKSMVDNFVYEIEHYGRILNANRSYYLLRSQPPFLTDMALKIYEGLVRLPDVEMNPTVILGEQSAEDWLCRAMKAAIREYKSVWMSEPRYIPSIGLSRYCGDGKGVPPETEATHFDSLLRPYAEKHKMDMATFIGKYNSGEISEPILDEYFQHDRAVRESGHDTTYRLDGRAANLCTIDLCALLYKYEVDIAEFLEKFCGGHLEVDGRVEEASKWTEAATKRKKLADDYLWNEEKGMYFDFDFVRQEQIAYESVTTLWALWSGMASYEQAKNLVEKGLPKFEMAGGLVSGTAESLGDITLDRPTRQWDHPTGWAPHQILAWEGLHRYAYPQHTRRLAYRWLYMITRAFSDFNGVVPEKFNVVRMSHKVAAEYGNVGTDFKRVPREGFAWVNASYLIGQRHLSLLERRALGTLVPPESLLKWSKDLVSNQDSNKI